MDLSSQEEEIPIPISSSYGHGRMIHHEPANHNQIVPNSASAAAHIPANGPLSTAMEMEEHVPYKRMIKYRECLKNHAAAMGGNATDGCGEFMPSGEEGTLEALTCSACNCHRNFHRKEVEGEPSPCCHECFHAPHLNRVGRKLFLGHLGPESQGYPTGPYINSRPPPPPPAAAYHHHHQMMMSYNTIGSFPSESDEQEEGVGGGGGGGGGGFVVGKPTHHHHHQLVKKRFRTKFTQEQKEKMLNFAEKVGWKIQKQEESVVQQFCQEIGVKRRVLKVWMHNNKHSLAKKIPSTAENTNPI